MPDHIITTESLLQAIDDQRADEASNRWQEISREYMSESPDSEGPDTEGSASEGADSGTAAH